MKLVIALDMPTHNKNLRLIECLSSLEAQQKRNIWLKVGLRSFIRDGIKIIESIKKYQTFNIFLDLKLYDIPNTMLDSLKEISKLDIDMITIHASSGKEAMKALAEYKKTNKSPLILAVSALTSFDEATFSQIYNAPLKNHTKKLATLAYECGLDGIVCSCNEVEMIKAYTEKKFIALTPAIRPFSENSFDQKRVADIAMAKAVGSDFIVIGRPIYQAKDPLTTTKKILELMA